MNCPYCGREMESGFLQAAGAFVWNCEARTLLIPNRQKGEFYIVEPFDDERAVPSFHCRDCEVLITPLSDLSAAKKRAGKEQQREKEETP